jgi:type IV pilus modification protein PilV
MIIRKFKNESLKNEQGFTIVEVMVALAILSFGILAVASMQTSSLLSTTRSNAVTVATNIATDRMERLISLPFDTVATLSNGDNSSSYFSGAPPLPSNIESVEWEVEAFQVNMKKITVTVQYREMRNPVIIKSLKIKV